MSKVISANTLATGAVVFLGKDGTWVGSIDQAMSYGDADAAEQGLVAAMQDVAKAIVVEPFATDAGPMKDGRPTMTLRDTIRAYGPTINYLSGKISVRDETSV